MRLTAWSTSRRSARSALTRSRTCSRSARKSPRASSRLTRATAASACPSRPPTTPTSSSRPSRPCSTPSSRAKTSSPSSTPSTPPTRQDRKNRSNRPGRDAFHRVPDPFARKWDADNASLPAKSGRRRGTGEQPRAVSGAIVAPNPIRSGGPVMARLFRLSDQSSCWKLASSILSSCG